MAKYSAEFLGFDLSTTALSAGARSAYGQEGFVSIPMEGAKEWNDQPAFDLDVLPDLLLQALDELMRQGWIFSPPGALSFSVRQHDMVVLGKDFLPLIPALSWQCNAASREMKELKEMDVEAIVGPIEERFILPKLWWTMRKEPNIQIQAHHVMTTGDYIAFLLTDKLKMSTSDALSNGLLNQGTKNLAIGVIVKAGFKPEWFPGVIQSGEVIGSVLSPDSGPKAAATHSCWSPVKTILDGWQVIAGLGDNHAGGVGCGLADFETIVISAGSSGTVNRKCSPNSELKGQAACFEYYSDRLLLMMLADCAKWYNRFVKKYGRNQAHNELDDMALNKADLEKLQRVRQTKTQNEWQEIYPAEWNKKPLPDKVASTQASIALELLLLVKKMLREVKDAPAIKRFVLTGGLSQSQFFQNVLWTGLSELVANRSTVLLSSQKGPLAFQSATRGAMINAMIGARKFPDLSQAIVDLCPLKKASSPDIQQRRLIINFLCQNLNAS